MKKLVSINKINEIDLLNNYVDGYVVGLENYSINFPVFSLSDIDLIIKKCKENNKEIFVVLNKNIHNNEIENVKEILKKFKDINGLFFYDAGIINIKDELNLPFDLVWANEHQTCNYKTINYYNDFGVNYAYLSTDITLKESLEIKENSKSKIILNVFGYLTMFASYRHLVNNYINRFNLKNESKINYLEKENNKYKIIDNNLGTFVYTEYIYSILDELDSIEKVNMDYILINGFLFDNLEDVLKNIDNGKYINEKYNTKPYFKDLETVYKVK